MKIIFPIIGFIMLLACGQKSSNVKALNLKNVQVSGVDSAYLEIPDQRCTLHVDTGRLHFLMKIKMLKRFLLPVTIAPSISVRGFDASGNMLDDACFFVDFSRFDSATCVFFNAKPGPEMKLEFICEGSKNHNLIDLMNAISAIKIDGTRFHYDYRFASQESLDYFRNLIKKPNEFLACMEKELDSAETKLTDTDHMAIIDKLVQIRQYQYLALENLKNFTSDQRKWFFKINKEYVNILDKATDNCYPSK